MPAKKNTLIEFLDINGISYETIRHEEAITAQEIAAAAHVSGHELAKTVIITVDGEMAMARGLRAGGHAALRQPV